MSLFWEVKWQYYLLFARCFLVWLEKQFEKLGKAVTLHPKATVLMSLIGVSVCAAGLARMKFESKAFKLFVPQNSLSAEALEIGSPFFQNSLNVRQEEIILIPRNFDGNVIQKSCIQDAVKVMQNIEAIPEFKRLCKQKPDFALPNSFAHFDHCQKLSILEILGSVNNTTTEIIQQSIKSALANASLLMSNGKNMRRNLKEAFAGFKINQKNRSVSAKALRIVIFMQQGQNGSHEERIMQWEKEFIAKMKGLKSQLENTDLFYTAERSLDDSIGESSSADVSLVSIAFTVMNTFVCLMLSKFINPIRGHNWLAFSGLITNALGILAGIGVAVAFGVPFISLVGIVPFLVVSIGIDNMFILVDEYDRQPESMASRDRVKFTLSKVGATITMTALTDVLAFYVSTTTSFPAIRYFCIYIALCISFEFVLRMTLFIAFLTFDSIRMHQNRCDLLPCLEFRDQNCCNITSKMSLSSRVMQHYGRYLLQWPVKMLVIVLSLCMIVGGIFGCLHINDAFNKSSLALPDSYFKSYVKTFENTFPQTLAVNIQVTKKVDYSDPFVRQEIAKSVKIAYETGYYLPTNVSWISSFEEYVAKLNIPADGPNFTAALSAFLSTPEYRQYKLDVITDKSNKIVASRTTVFYKDNKGSEFQKNAMKKLREKLKSKLSIDVTISSNAFIHFEQYAVVMNEVIWSLAFVLIVIALVMLPFCIHPLIVLILVVSFAALSVELFGWMCLWDVQLNSISMINLVMAIGFTVDYSFHVVHAFVISREDTPDKRIIQALGSAGASVLLGGVSTFIGISLTGFAKSIVFKIFFKMSVGIIFFGLYNGLVLLPVLLSIISKWLSSDIKTKYLDLGKINMSRQCKTKRKASAGESGTTVSILGMSTRFPLAENKKKLWELLDSGINTVSEYPKNRGTRYQLFEAAFNPSKGVPGKHYVLHGSYLEEIDGFDYRFFGISEAEATSMDPQQRMLLQGTYEAIEDAGMTIEELQQCCTGVYIGIMNLDFTVVNYGPTSQNQTDQFGATGSSMSISANRVSFAFNFSGPSIAFDTACSSSLTALAVACDHLEKGIIDVAVVGAANLILDQLKHSGICEANMLSMDGKCKSFDESADGYGRGEGVVVFILKGTNFVAKKDETYGEIISWAINNDGQTSAPMTAPSIIGQRTLMDDALQQCGIDPCDVQYVEMHGTGTYIGDVVETTSVGEVYGQSKSISNPVLIGSIKSNIGHTESTAACAGIAKVCLMMEHEQFVPTVGIKEQAVRLALEDKRLHVCTENSPWPSYANGFPRIAAVNSFGFGGSNGHILIREKEKSAKEDEPSLQDENLPRMLILSTKSSKTLAKMAESFSTWLTSIEDNAKNQANLCYTLSERRTRHSHRMVVHVASLQDASNALKEFAEDPDLKSIDICSGKASNFSSKIAFVFGGQGSQWLGMAGDLLSNNDVLATVKKVDQAVKEAGVQASVLAYLSNEFEWSKVLTDDLVATQLAIFALEYSVAQFMINKAGVQPIAVTGHSLGDITAACVANVISLFQAAKIISIRAKVQDKCQRNGAMAAVGLSEDETNAIIKGMSLADKLSIAATNDKNNVTISGDEDAIIEFEKCVKEKKETTFIRKLDTNKAFHSHHMDAIKQKFMEKLSKANIVPKNGSVQFFSTTEGREVYGAKLTNEFWWRNLRNPVQFNASIWKMMKKGIRVLVEISPRPVLSHYMREIAQQTGTKDTTIVQALPKKGETERLKHLHIQCIGKLFTVGCTVNFNMLQDYSSAELLRYPSYPWDEHRMWPKDEYPEEKRTMMLLGTPISLNNDHCIWENEIDLHCFPYLKDHRTKSLGVIFPGAGFIELVFEAAIMKNKVQPLVIGNVKFKMPLVLNESMIQKLRCTKQTSNGEESDKCEIKHLTDQGEHILSTAEIIMVDKESSNDTLSFSEALESAYHTYNEYQPLTSAKELASVEGTSSLRDLASLKNTGLSEHDWISLEELSEYTKSTEFLFGERFKLIDAAWGNDEIALSRLKLSEDLIKESKHYIIHPCVLDACLQTKVCIDLKKAALNNYIAPHLPIGVDEIKTYPIKRRLEYIYCIAKSIDNHTYDFIMIDEEQNILMQLDRVKTKELAGQKRNPSQDKSIYSLHWSPTSKQQLEDDTARIEDYFLLISFENEELNRIAASALRKLGVRSDNIWSIVIPDIDCDIQEKLQPLLTEIFMQRKEIVILNMLPMATKVFPFEVVYAAKALWLCFESTLEILKILSKLDMSNSRVIAIGCSSERKLYSAANKMNPWKGISRGMAATADLELRQRVISVELICNVDESAFIRLILVSTKNTAEDRIEITDKHVLEPVMKRHDFKLKRAKDDNENVKETLRKQDGFYLSWSQFQQVFELKKISENKTRVLPGFAEVRASHLSSAFGQAKNIVEEIRQYEPKRHFQCVSGSIDAIAEGVQEFKIGDEVIAFITSKWVKSRVLVPVTQLLKKPSFLSKKQAAVASASFAYAYKLLDRFQTCGKSGVTMHVAWSDVCVGICWMVAKVAEAKGIHVTMQDISNPKLKARGLEDEAHSIDYLVYSSDLHPADVHRLIGRVHKDGIVIFVNLSGKSCPFTLTRAATVANVTFLNEINPESLMSYFNKDLPMLQSILKEMPAIQIDNIVTCITTDVKNIVSTTEATFNCLEMEYDDCLPMLLKPASLDYQGLKEDRTYIVAGGTRGIGLKTVQWMASRGAQTILVIGKSPISHSMQIMCNELRRKYETHIVHVRADIANEDEMKAVDEVLEKLPPVAGVINSAGVLDDKEFYKIDRNSYQKVMGPKVNGTLNLQSLVDRKQQELDFFVLYSSVASLFGNQGQASYSAANDFLNSFAEFRRHVCGKPCLSICWGAMAGAGMLNRNLSLALVLENAGIFMLNIDQGIRWMEEILLSNPPETNLCISDVDWDRFTQTLSKGRSLVSCMQLEVGSNLNQEGEGILVRLKNASSKEDQECMLLEFIKTILVSFTGGSEDEIDCFVPLVNYGVDSVGASLFKSKIMQGFNIDLEVFFFMLTETTPTVLANVLLKKLHESNAVTCEPLENLNSQEEEKEFLHRRTIAGRRFYSFHAAAPQHTSDADRITLPDDYLTAIYDPPEAIAKIFIVHPSHRYAGVFQAIASGMKYQELFSLYAFGYQDPGCIGEDYRTVRSLAEACTELLLRIEPSGPYFLAGYSFGGIVAIEMATILQNTGRTVALLSMIDTFLWISESECNSKALIDLFSYQPEHYVVEQVKEYFERLALTQLKITKKEYKNDTSKLEVHEIADYLSDRAHRIQKKIPDGRVLLQSILDDYKMATLATSGWYPPENMYTGPVVFIKAETCLCQYTQTEVRKCFCSQFIGSSFERWSSLLTGNAFLAICSGDHFSMVERNRGQDVGNVLATAASFIFRKHSLLLGGIKLNANHDTAREICKTRGIKVCMIRRSAFKRHAIIGRIVHNGSGRKITFEGKDLLSGITKIEFGDVIFIRKVTSIDVQKLFESFSFTNQGLHSGFLFQLLKQKVTFMCFNKQDFNNFRYLLEAIYGIKLQV